MTMKNKTNVLIFPAGEVNSVELHDSLATCVNINLFGASSSGKERHGSYIFKHYANNLPHIDADNFINKFNEYLEQNQINIIFPTHDSVVEFFAKHIPEIKAKIIMANQDTSIICRDKLRLYETFNGAWFLPKIYDKISLFPVFIKPRVGQGGIGAMLVENNLEIPQAINLNEYVICEYLPGVEYTVDCLTDRQRNLVFCSPRSRERMMAGICVAGEIKPLTREIEEIAMEINRRLLFEGLWYFQIKRNNNGEWRLLEVSTRCAGSMCLTRARGVNLPLLSIYIAQGFDIEINPNNYKVRMDRTLISRYKIDYHYDVVYFDLDDTLIVREQVNPYAIMFLYQCRNLGKKILLLTKHKNELSEVIAHYAIDKNIFSEIVHINEDENKSDYISCEKAIFVDNSYQERRRVASVHGIPVFDVDGIEVLLDWRI
jgi:predicted ATP-grasp superfamily ATP-dependent carboligase